jgi:hypothetical protein
MAVILLYFFSGIDIVSLITGGESKKNSITNRAFRFVRLISVLLLLIALIVLLLAILSDK